MGACLDFQCDGCRMILYMPDAMEEMPVSNAKKFLQWADKDRWRNEESMQRYFNYIPEILSDLEAKWGDEGLTFQREYLDPKFDHGNYIKDKTEREKRKAHNEKLLSRVKAAKSRYERFKKKAQKLEELKKQYEF